MSIGTHFVNNPLAVLPEVKARRRYTLAEYLRKEASANVLHEYSNGYITKVPMAKATHNLITMNIATALNNSLRAADKKYLVLGAQQLVYLPKLNISRYTDMLVVCETPEFYDQNEILLTNPILIVEILSKSTRTYDRTGKFEEYKTLASFQEYLLIDQSVCHLEQRFREEPDLWRDTNLDNLAGGVYFKSLVCAVQIADIYQNVNLTK
jgi:Uma2 family endonuclease